MSITPVHPGNRGQLTLGLMFKPVEGKTKGILHIHVKSAKALPNMDDHGYTDGFVKMTLLPDKKKRKKTKVINDDLNPVWNEKFTFTNVSLDELSLQRVLEVTVWDHDMLSSNDFVGGIRLGPSSIGEADKGQEWMDANNDEARHWKEMLAHPGEWVEQSHSLRVSMEPRKFDSPDPDLVSREEVSCTPHTELEENSVVTNDQEAIFRQRVRVYMIKSQCV